MGGDPVGSGRIVTGTVLSGSGVGKGVSEGIGTCVSVAATVLGSGVVVLNGEAVLTGGGAVGWGAGKEVPVSLGKAAVLTARFGLEINVIRMKTSIRTEIRSKTPAAGLRTLNLIKHLRFGQGNTRFPRHSLPSLYHRNHITTLSVTAFFGLANGQDGVSSRVAYNSIAQELLRQLRWRWQPRPRRPTLPAKAAAMETRTEAATAGKPLKDQHVKRGSATNRALLFLPNSKYQGDCVGNGDVEGIGETRVDGEGIGVKVDIG